MDEMDNGRNGRRLLAAFLATVLSGCDAGVRQELTPPPAAAPPDPVAAASWLAVDPPAGPGSLAPELHRGSSKVLLTWLEPADPAARQPLRLLVAHLDGDVWGAPREITAGGGFFANWADRPAVVETAAGDLVAHWLEKLGAGTYAYGVELARSVDDGATWQRLGRLHDDASATEHGFVSWVETADGLVAFWLDGRRMVGEDGGPMELRTAVLAADASSPPASTLLDGRVCECCATDAAATSDGPIVVYRDRGDDEVRDIAVVRATAGGWSEPRILHPDGWRIHGCPVNGPAIAARGPRVAVAWFSLAGGEAPQVKVAFSADAGATFDPPLLVAGEDSLGRVDVELDDEGGAFVSWLAAAGEIGETRLRHVQPGYVQPGGEAGAVRTVTATTQGRGAGVPRMVRAGPRLVFVWVEDADPSRLRAGVFGL